MIARRNGIDPYQILFPMGWLHACLGAGSWILFALQLRPYPAQFHAFHMIAGFLLTFAAGFLMTAIPRFTGAQTCSPQELLFMSFLSFTSLVFDHPALPLAMCISLIFFAAKRFATRTHSPPPHFVFLPVGILFGAVGTLLMLLVQEGLMAFEWIRSARLFFYYGMMLSFLFGIGAKLISALLGWAEPPLHQIQSASQLHQTKSSLDKYMFPVIQLCVFIAGFALQAWDDRWSGLGKSVVALVGTWIAVQNWHLHRKPKIKSKLSFWIWISAWNLVIGLWVHALFPHLGVHAAHLIFIGGLGLMTLMISSRVTLAHGDFDLGLEKRSRVYGWTGALIVLAAATRFSALWTSNFVHHLGYAAFVWLIAIFIWGFFFIPKMLPKLKWRLR